MSLAGQAALVMSTAAALTLGFGLGVLVAAPLVAPLGIWLMERNASRPSKPADYSKWPQ
jgi:hypothetical protein